MRMDTLISICTALKITPSDVLYEEDTEFSTEEIMEKLQKCGSKERNTALKILSLYLDSI